MDLKAYNKIVSNELKVKSELSSEYFEHKNKGGQDLYDYISKHKKALQDVFKENKKELDLISLVPSYSENYAMSPEERKEKNRNMRYQSNLKGAKIPEPPRDIKDVREQYDPLLTNMDEEESKRELISKGYYNPSEEDVKAHQEKRKTEDERVRKADKWEQMNPLLKIGLSFVAPRISESLQEGYSPSMKDIGLDIGEGIATSVGPGVILKSARAIKPLSKLIAKGIRGLKSYKATGMDTANPIMGTVGQLAESAGTAGLAELPIELGLNTADKLVYSGDRSRGTDEMSIGDLKDITGKSIRGAMITGIGSGMKAKNTIDPTAQAKLNKLNELENLAYPTIKKEKVELDENLLKDIKELKQYDLMANTKTDPRIEKEIETFLTTTNAQQLIKDYAKRNNVDVSTAYDAVKKQADELCRYEHPNKFFKLSSDAKLEDFSDFAKKRKEKLIQDAFINSIDKGAFAGGLLDLGLTRGNASIDLLDMDTGY